ncbi:MAG: hypothetical protein ACOC5L_03165 [Halobacteriota archaeon]
MRTLSIRVPDGIGVLVEKDELLKKSLEDLVTKSFREKLLKFFVAEEMTRDGVSEDEVLRIDDEIKEKAWKELKGQWNL